IAFCAAAGKAVRTNRAAIEMKVRSMPLHTFDKGISKKAKVSGVILPPLPAGNNDVARNTLSDSHKTMRSTLATRRATLESPRPKNEPSTSQTTRHLTNARLQML